MLKTIIILILSTAFNLTSVAQNPIQSSEDLEACLKNPLVYTDLILEASFYKRISGFEYLFCNTKKVVIYNSINVILPKTFSKFPCLEKLVFANINQINLSNNLKEISKFKHLEVLEINDTEIQLVPDKLNELKISKLILTNCKIDKLSAKLNKLRVSSLDLSGNDLSKASLIALANNKSIKNLFLIDCSLIKFPLNLSNMKNLNYLVLSDNKINSLPKNILGFNNLEAIELSGNHISCDTLNRDILFPESKKEVILSCVY